ncbi:thiamine diphosphokinase [Gymnodinialimonas ceratoperidinii]|uniref:Thiamine diphosphokinase n=1 Tax=Gymnodinialimonas ceratoperidinii TaxID=2856823 RepID=A0A8F6TZL5_9RHOB|nr:thiamine diphosphokinase [Gymnodinialimonas ceratoperidinii]QXT40919.1 thiamine diphosphokinase [Gymnodinialimonas ceratoperidinii]
MPLIYKDSVVLVGGAPVTGAVFDLVRKRADIFFAADGGADALLQFGVIPDAVIGDLDSLSEAGRGAIPAERIIEVSEQDSTDFEKALRGIKAPLVYAVGFTGARLDHGLAALHVLSRFSDRPVLLVGEEDVTVHLPARIVLDLDPGLRLSLFPLDAVTVGMSGLRWSFEALALHPLHKIGTSNEVSAPQVVLTSDAPGVMLIVPRAALGAVEDALLRADLHSPQT